MVFSADADVAISGLVVRRYRWCRGSLSNGQTPGVRRKISRDYLRELFTYLPRLGYLMWNDSQGSIAGYVCKNSGYRLVEIDGKPYRAHRLIWMYLYGRWPAHEIDHKNGNRSDNRIRNLREASDSENVQNQKIRSDNLSGYRGVFFSASANRWVSQICKNGKRIHLGYFDTARKASIVYEKTAKKLFGKFYRKPKLR